MTASKIQAKIAKFCDREDIYYNKTITMSRAGFPDIIICIKNKLYAIEVKSEEDVLSSLQNETLRILGDCGFVVKTFQDFVDLVEYIRKIDKGGEQ